MSSPAPHRALTRPAPRPGPGRSPLRVVPRTRRPATRVPFVALVSLLLLTGVVGLLLFNTSMQQASFAATALEYRASTLSAREQSLRMDLDRLDDPQRVARQAQRLGMVMPAVPAFVHLGTGEVSGEAVPASEQDRFSIEPSRVANPYAVPGARPERSSPGRRGAAADGASSGERAPDAGRTGPQQTQQSQQSQQSRQSRAATPSDGTTRRQRPSRR